MKIRERTRVAERRAGQNGERERERERDGKADEREARFERTQWEGAREWWGDRTGSPHAGATGICKWRLVAIVGAS